MHLRVFFAQINMHIAEIFFGGGEVTPVEYDENLKYTYFERQYDQIVPLHVYFFTNHRVCM